MSTTLKTERRERVGTRQSQSLRAKGRIPASLQAEGERPQVSLSISEEEFLTARRHHEHVYTLAVGDVTQSALVKELQWDTFGERILHVEFRRVDLDKKTEVEITLEFIGHPKAGLVNHLVTSVMISAKPEQIPDSIEVRVDGMEIGDLILARDLKLPEGLELVVEPELVVANITAPTEEKAAEGEEEAEGDVPEGGTVAVPEANPEG